MSREDYLKSAEKLKKARLEKGISLEELQRKTKIHLNILRAIEGDSLSSLSEVYLRSFIKIYCQALGINYHEYLSEEKQAVPLEDKLEKKECLLKPQKSQFSLKTFYARKSFLRVLGIIFLAATVFLILSKISSCLKKLGVKQPPQKEIAAAREENKTKSQSLNQPLAKNEEGIIHLIINAKDSSLVYLKADGKVVFHRTLEKGRSLSWKAKEKIELSLGNASVIELVINGQRFNNLTRKKGQPLRNILITEKEGIKIPY